jgi:hypothetical protein
VAVSSFLLLWAIVIVNSFSTKKSQIKKMRKIWQDLSQHQTEVLQRISVLLQENGITPIDYSNPVEGISDINRKYDPFEEELAHLELITQNHNSLRQSESFKQIMAELEENITLLQRTQTRLYAAVKDYNIRRRQMPIRLFAGIFGFRSMPTIEG